VKELLDNFYIILVTMMQDFIVVSFLSSSVVYPSIYQFQSLFNALHSDKRIVLRNIKKTGFR